MKARSRPTRQAAQQHKYADMKQDGLNGGYPGGAEDEPTPVRYIMIIGFSSCCLTLWWCVVFRRAMAQKAVIQMPE